MGGSARNPEHDVTATPGGIVLVLLAARPGDPVDAATASVPDADHVIAADSGLHLARSLGVRADVVIGDLDSVDQSLLAEAVRGGTTTDVYPRDKDHTDLALALRAAAATSPARIVVLGGAGGRLDHGLANLHALTDDGLDHCQVSAWLGGARVDVVRDVAVTLTGSPGQLVSLIAVGEPARHVTTNGLRWELHDADMAPSDTRGVSNEFVGTTATVVAGAGCLLAIRPAPEPLDRSR